MSENSVVIREKIRFRGIVQGVGFRYTAQYAARSCGVTGWVKNKRDGSVVMEVQGTRRQIDEMIRILHSGPYIQIDTMDVASLPLKDYESGFHIE